MQQTTEEQKLATTIMAISGCVFFSKLQQREFSKLLIKDYEVKLQKIGPTIKTGFVTHLKQQMNC